MPQVTDIRPQKRQKRVNIFLDGKFSFGLDLETLAKTGLKVGQEVSEKKVEEIIREGEFAKIYNRVLKFLSYRPRCEKELSDWFKRKGVGERTKNLVLRKLKKLNLLDDKNFAKWWIEQRISFRPRGARLIKLELLKKGISREAIERLFEEINIDFSEEKRAKKAAEKKFKSLKNLTRPKQKEKLSQFLLRRGFSWETIRKVLDDVF